MAKEAASTSTPCLSTRAPRCFPERCTCECAADKLVLSAQHQLRPDIEVDFETLHFVNIWGQQQGSDAYRYDKWHAGKVCRMPKWIGENCAKVAWQADGACVFRQRSLPEWKQLRRLDFGACELRLPKKYRNFGNCSFTCGFSLPCS
jgi:hypothetical protein